jgi:hypothetical protein
MTHFILNFADVDMVSVPILLTCLVLTAIVFFVGGRYFRKASVKEQNERRAYENKRPAPGSKPDSGYHV